MWANYLLPKALKSCQMSNKSPNLVTLNSSPTDKLILIRAVVVAQLVERSLLTQSSWFESSHRQNLC